MMKLSTARSVPCVDSLRRRRLVAPTRPVASVSAIGLAAACLVLLASAPGHAGAEEGEWKELLSGDSLTEHWVTDGNWKLDDGVATLTPREGESGWSRWSSYLWLKEAPWRDFEIEFEYRLEKAGNSGFYFHVGDREDPVQQGIEVQIYDSASHPPDKPLNDHDSGGIIPGVPPTKRTAKPPGEWNRFHIVCRDRKLTVKLNGELVNEIDLDDPKFGDRPAEGSIGFQDHALPISLRKIRIRRLG